MDKLMAALVMLVVLQGIMVIVLFFMNLKLADKCFAFQELAERAVEIGREANGDLESVLDHWHFPPVRKAMMNFIFGGRPPEVRAHYSKHTHRGKPKFESLVFLGEPPIDFRFHG